MLQKQSCPPLTLMISLLVLALFTNPLLSQELPTPPVSLTVNQQKTLDSVELTNDYPSYSMTYYGDYGLSDFLKTGVYPWFMYVQEKVGNCSTMAALNKEGDIFYGRNVEWSARLPTNVIFTNPSDGYASVSVTTLTYYHRYFDSGSDDDKQYFLASPYQVHDGMNECGVAIAEMSVGPDPEGGQNEPGKINISGLDLIRLVLDRASSVDEALELIKGYNNSESHLAHYLVADAAGNSAVIEYQDKKLVITRNSEPWQVCTNFKILQGDPEEIRSRGDRYRRAYDSLKTLNGKVTSDEMFDIVESISVPGTVGSKTEWSSLYNLSKGEMKVAISHDFEHPLVYKLEMANDLEVSAPALKKKTIKAGRKNTITFEASNNSCRTAPETTAKIFLYKKNNFTPIEFGEVKIPSLKTGEKKSFKSKIRIPKDIKPGSYQVMAEIQTLGQYKDYKPENNSAVSKQKMRVTR